MSPELIERSAVLRVLHPSANPDSMVSQLDVSSASPAPPSSRPWLQVVRGNLQIFTCTYRSFFTHVMAQALRAAGQGTSVLVVQFLKGGIHQGPHRPVQLNQHLDWLRCDTPSCIQSLPATAAEQAAVTELWAHTRAVVLAGQYALVVLDELSVAIQLGLIPAAEVMDLIHQRPPHVDVILTGPDMPAHLLDLADQVTELRRHPLP